MGREINVDSIRTLEEQIEEHEKTIIKLKRARNSLLNVSALPPEVLGHIFSQNVTLRDPFGGLEEGSHNFLLVCHHWFEVASRTPELWSFWGTSLEQWEERCLRSNVSIPLDLVLDGLPYMFDPVSESQRMALEDRAKRDTIRRIHLQGDMRSLLTSIIAPLLSPYGGLRTNSLESLILFNEESRALDVSFLTQSRLPNLQLLELAGCTISSWDHLTSQTSLLTSLKIFFDESSPTPSMPQLLLVLSSNPYLQKLALNRRAVPNDEDNEPCQVLLLHLEELQLEGDPRQIFGLLRRLELPNKMNMLSLDISRCAVADISQTVGPYLRDYLRCRGMSRDGLGVCLSSYSSITLNIGDVSRLDSSASILSRMISFVSISVWLDQALPKDALEKLSLDFITYTPREEIVHFRSCGNLEALKDLGARMPNLKALDLLRVSLSAVFQAPGQGRPYVDEMFPPSLQHLFLGQLVSNGWEWPLFIAFLSRRESSGNRLDSLRIEGPCHMCWRVSEEVRDAVRRFNIDDECLESWCPFDRCPIVR